RAEQHAQTQTARYDGTQERFIKGNQEDKTEVNHHHGDGERDRDTPSRGGAGLEGGRRHRGSEDTRSPADFHALKQQSNARTGNRSWRCSVETERLLFLGSFVGRARAGRTDEQLLAVRERDVAPVGPIRTV